MKCYILYKFRNAPWGGANQFLKALRKAMEACKCYSKNIAKADIILCNLNPSSFSQVLGVVSRFRDQYSRPRLVVRIDGPVSGIRNTDTELDRSFIKFINIAADAVVFQSDWSRRRMIEIAPITSPNTCVISNAPDKNLFTKSNTKITQHEKIKLVAVSWSPNLNKGFDVYKYLDETLDYSTYQFTFIGNSPVKFENIEHIKPLMTEQLALELQKHHIYITGSRSDPCSNSLIEALHSGLPAIAYNDGGHPEIVGNAGRLFDRQEQILGLIEEIAANYEKFVESIKIPDISQIAEEYNDFFLKIANSETPVIEYSDKNITSYCELLQKFPHKKESIIRQIGKILFAGS